MIRTFIFLDLETTGLITKTCMPKVTEMSLIAVSRTAICNTTDILPRVLQKLVLPIYPNTHISKEIETLTGLSNKNLKEVRYFNHEVYNLVLNFINRQTAPTCFVAYNGNNFDYPILLSELKNIEQSFSEDILSIDMLHLIKDFFSLKQDLVEETNDTQTTNTFSAEANILLNDGYDQILCEAVDTIMNTTLGDDNKSKTKNTSVLKTKKATSNSEDMLNTPQTSYNKMQQINEKTPENQIIKLQARGKNFEKKVITARRKLDFTNSQPTNFKLSNVYKHMFGTVPGNAHSAEGDCLTMICCAIQLGNFFVEWADCKAVPVINFIKQ